MLKTRIITALIIFAATVAAVFLAPSSLFRGLLALLLMTGCWEFRKLAKLPTVTGYLLLALQAFIIGFMMYYWPAVMAQAPGLLSVACVFWMLMLGRLFFYRAGATPGSGFQWLGFLSALGAITFCWFGLAWLHDRPDGPFIVFLLLLIIWASDVGAYFSGRRFGKNKLAPVISPKKTWEGVYGGIALALLAAFVWANLIAGLAIPVSTLVIMTVITALASIGGDLFISIHKRTVGLKDTGAIFPGHGGVLDRYDSLLTGAPFFALAYQVLGS